jgi:type II secretory pathway pseudopilin PulG
MLYPFSRLCRPARSPASCGPAVRKKRGFNLIESAIVLGVVGLVIGGIWVAAAAVSEDRKVEEVVQGILSTVKNIQKNISISDGLAIGGGGVNITSSVISMNAFPESWVQNGQLKTPFNGSAYVHNFTTGGSDARFDLNIVNVPRAACIKLVVRITTLAYKVQMPCLRQQPRHGRGMYPKQPGGVGPGLAA